MVFFELMVSSACIFKGLKVSIRFLNFIRSKFNKVKFEFIAQR